MDNLIKKTVFEDRLCFKKETIVSIENINIGDYFYVKIRNPLSYGNTYLEYFAKLISKTDKFFTAFYYEDGMLFNSAWSDGIRIDQIPLKEKYAKKFSKERIREVREVSVEIKNIFTEYWTNKPEN